MAQSDFEAAIVGVESSSGDTKEADLITFFSQLTAALDVRIAAANNPSPAAQKLRGVRDRSLALENEVDASGAGLVLRPDP